MRKYLSYKPSDLEWVDELPTHWNITKLKSVSNLVISSIDKHILENERNVLVCNYTDVYYNEFISSKLQFKNGSCSDDEYNKFILNKGDVIITKDSESPNDIGVPSLVVEELDNVVCGYHLSIIKPLNQKVLGGFLFRQLQTKRIRNYFEICSNGITRFGLGKSSVLNTPLVLPPLPEQLQIVQFLDEKTELIDKLISKKERKITLLKEQRTSLINEVITKGLNPEVEMKDSGDEWIGKIPENWNVLKLKNISDLRISSVDKHIFENENQVKVCNYTDVYYNEFISSKLDFRNGSCSDDELLKYSLNNGDVIITKDSESPNDIGVPSLVVEEIDNLVCGYHLSIIKPNTSKMIGGFLFRQLQTKRIRNYYEVCSNGITRFGLGKLSVLETPLIVPPIQEQKQIVEYLDIQTKEIDDLVSMEQRKIDLLKEYRQSLISEVITGKIDVRTNPN